MDRQGERCSYPVKRAGRRDSWCSAIPAYAYAAVRGAARGTWNDLHSFLFLFDETSTYCNGETSCKTALSKEEGFRVPILSSSKLQTYI